METRLEKLIYTRKKACLNQAYLEYGKNWKDFVDLVYRTYLKGFEKEYYNPFTNEVRTEFSKIVESFFRNGKLVTEITDNVRTIYKTFGEIKIYDDEDSVIFSHYSFGLRLEYVYDELHKERYWSNANTFKYDYTQGVFLFDADSEIEHDNFNEAFGKIDLREIIKQQVHYGTEQS